VNTSRSSVARSQTAELDFAARLKAAIALFDAPDKPLWRRTVDGMLAFKGLNMDDLPPRILRRIDRRFVAINRILARYALQTWGDYQHITDDDLRRLQDNIRGLASNR
jgi:hypothetical protein